MLLARLIRRRVWLGLFAGAVGTFTFALNCGDSGGSAFDDCRSLYGDQCGTACADDGQCGAGLHCADGFCNAQCGPGKSCNGLVCTTRGLCTTDGFGTSDASNIDNTPGDGCADLSVTLSKRTPTVQVLVDRSGSMLEDFGSSTRWVTLKRVLLGDAGVLSHLQSEVVFGLTMYANPSNPSSCPDLSGVPYALNNFNAINALLGPAATQPETPTGEAILSITGLNDAGAVVNSNGFATYDAGGGEKIILLVTDGDPDYCGNPQANDPPLSAPEVQAAKDISVNAARRAFEKGIKTYILAIGADVSIPHQQAMANAGLGLPADAAAPYFRPNNEQELIDQINAIIYGARPCKYTLNGTVQPGRESSGTVLLNGNPLTFNDPNGWRLASPSELELVGAACEEVKRSTNASVTASFPCGSVLPR